MRRAIVLLAIAAGAVLAGGAGIAATWHLSFGHGVFCSLGLASTVGCDAQPDSAAGRLVAVAIILVVMPLVAAAFGQLHLDKVRQHVDTRLGEHHKTIHAKLDQIEQDRAAAPAVRKTSPRRKAQQDTPENKGKETGQITTGRPE